MNLPPMPDWFRGKYWDDCTPEQQQAVRDHIRQIHEAQAVEQRPTNADEAVLAAARRLKR